jgi:hypothetical protein
MALILKIRGRNLIYVLADMVDTASKISDARDLMSAHFLMSQE